MATTKDKQIQELTAELEAMTLEFNALQEKMSAMGSRGQMPLVGAPKSQSRRTGKAPK